MYISIYYIYQINNQKQTQLFKKLLSTKLLKDKSNLKISFWTKMEYLTKEPSQKNSMIILLTMLKSYLKSWVKKNHKLQDYLKNPNKHNLFMKETDLKEVNKYLNNLDMKKANISMASPQNLLR